MSYSSVGHVIDGVVVDPVADDAPEVEKQADEEDGEGVDVGEVGEATGGRSILFGWLDRLKQAGYIALSTLARYSKWLMVAITWLKI